MHTEPALSRLYRHTACGGITEVSGDDYLRLECPFRGCNGTFCAGCRRFVGLDAVVWVDSGETIASYRQRIFDAVPFWEQVRLAVFANAYEGALNLNLDKYGVPRPGPRTFHLSEGRTGVPPAAAPMRMTIIGGTVLVLLGMTAFVASRVAEEQWKKEDDMAEAVAKGGAFLAGTGAVVTVFGLLGKKLPPETQ
jgi:hypothetical protein